MYSGSSFSGQNAERHTQNCSGCHCFWWRKPTMTSLRQVSQINRRTTFQLIKTWLSRNTRIHPNTARAFIFFGWIKRSHRHRRSPTIGANTTKVLHFLANVPTSYHNIRKNANTNNVRPSIPRCKFSLCAGSWPASQRLYYYRARDLCLWIRHGRVLHRKLPVFAWSCCTAHVLRQPLTPVFFECRRILANCWMLSSLRPWKTPRSTRCTAWVREIVCRCAHLLFLLLC